MPKGTFSVRIKIDEQPKKCLKNPKGEFKVTVNASPRYPIEETINVEANSYAMACQKAIKEYFKRHKNFRTTFCRAYATFVGKITREEEE